jgi:hypothetical protein
VMSRVTGMLEWRVLGKILRPLHCHPGRLSRHFHFLQWDYRSPRFKQIKEEPYRIHILWLPIRVGHALLCMLVCEPNRAVILCVYCMFLFSVYVQLVRWISFWALLPHKALFHWKYLPSDFVSNP